MKTAKSSYEKTMSCYHFPMILLLSCAMITGSELAHLLNSCDFAIIASRPRYQKLTQDEVIRLEESMESFFLDHNISFIRADGYYGGMHIPNSYIIPHPNPEEMITLAKSFSQESLILGQNGRIKLLNLLTGVSRTALDWHEVTSSQDNYTKVGSFKFTLDFEQPENSPASNSFP